MTTRDASWMEELIRSHHGRVQRYVALRLPAGEVDDAVAEVFAAAWKDRDKVPPTPLPWLLACARLRVLNSAAGRVHDRELLARACAQAHLSGQHAPDLDWIWSVLDSLHPDDREILCLDAWEGLSSAQLGRVLGCGAATARVRLFRARRRAATAAAEIRRAERNPQKTDPSEVPA